MPRVNLLPWREAERKRKRQEFIVASAGALLAAGVLSLVVNWQFESAINRQNERNQMLQNEIAQLDLQITEITGLEQQKQRLLARMDVVEQLQRSRPEVVHLFDQIARTIPEGIYLTGIRQTDRRVQLRGVAQSSTRVSTFMRNIEASEWLADPALEVVETQGTAGAGSRFTLYANQQNPEQPPEAAAGGGARASAAGASR